jgi:hypothetical protein
MLLKQRNIWLDHEQLDYICITTNSVVKKNGELVMGAGNADQAQKKIPNIAKLFGELITNKGKRMGVYNLVAVGKYIAFQTKIHYADPSPLEVVQKSCDILNKLARKYPNKIFGLPFPAINNGKRTVAEIMPMLVPLPDNVHVYHLKPL